MPEIFSQTDNPPTAPPETYHRLGKKTFLLFAAQRMRSTLILFLITAALFVLANQDFLADLPIVGDIQIAVAWAALGALVFFGLSFLTAFAGGWLAYANYKFCLAEDSFKVKRGVLNKHQISIPYRQIQNVDIEQSAAFQMLGLSRLSVLTAGHEDKKIEGDETEGVISPIDKNLAAWLQDELLKRANIEKVAVADTKT